MLSLALSAVAFAGAVVAQNTATSTAAVAAAAATAKTESPTSHRPGRVFDRYVSIWLENTDFDTAMADPNLSWLAAKGITLENMFGVTHPSEPNYVSVAAGDNLGMDNDNLNFIDPKVSSVIDILEVGGISWSEYQEDMPYSGFEGYSWINGSDGKNDYVRKHNPAIIFQANTNVERLAKIKNSTMFEQDLANDRLPQWIFWTPNMQNDGHDTSVTTAGAWTRDFLEPLLTNRKFMQRTLVLVTFDETETYTEGNRVMSILLGDAVPQHLVGTKDSTFYSHYSEIATVEANWGLHTLGRWDVGANVYDFVARETGDRNTAWDAVTGATPTRFLNESFAGPFNSVNSSVPYPVPNVHLVRNGRTVLPAIVEAYKGQTGSYYTNTVDIPDGLNPPTGWAN